MTDLGTETNPNSAPSDPTTSANESLEEIGNGSVPCQPMDLLRMREEDLE